MRHMVRLLVAAGVLASSGGSALQAQHPQTRQGFWIGFGGGYGSAGVSCDGCGNTDREGSASGFLKLGGTLSPSVLLGAEVNGWSKSESGVTVNLGNVSAAVYLYPVKTSGFFVKGGAGLSVHRTTGGGNTLDGTGWGLIGGLGYDIRVGRNISLTPVANYYFGQPGDLKINGTTAVTGWTQNVLDIGLGITFH